MKNMSSISKQHYVKLFSGEFNEKRSRNCRNKECCPIKKNFLKKDMVCKVKVLAENNFKLHYGTCDRECKSSFYNHMKSFQDEANENELSKYIWQLKNPKTITYIGKYLYMQHPINVAQGIAIYT